VTFVLWAAAIHHLPSRFTTTKVPWFRSGPSGVVLSWAVWTTATRSSTNTVSRMR
jgi:hypothetical protein